jgi:hypothetical protein
MGTRGGRRFPRRAWEPGEAGGSHAERLPLVGAWEPGKTTVPVLGEPEKNNFYLSGGLVPESGYNGYNGYKGEKWLKNAVKGAKNGQKDAKTGLLRRILVK